MRYSTKIDSESNLVIEEKTFTVSDSVLIQTLFDTDAEINIIFQHFTVKHQLKYIESELSQSQFIDDQRVYCFEVYQVRYQLIDIWEQSQNCEHIFYILNKAESAFILKLSALKAEHI